MKVTPTELEGVLLIEPVVFSDARGYFMESWNVRRYLQQGLPGNFVQDNLSRSRKGVLRGLHFQNPSPQGKLVSVLVGEVFDVAVDLRLGSPTFSRWTGELLSAENKRQLFVPEGFAHGFLVLSDEALFSYKCTAYYVPTADAGVRWDDPDIGIEWPEVAPVLSDKDACLPYLSELPEERLFQYDDSGIVKNKSAHHKPGSN